MVHLLLAGITMAAEWGMTAPRALSIADKHYISGNVFRDEKLVRSLPALPKSCVESANILLKKLATGGMAEVWLAKYAGPGGWNDPDYLLLGYLSNWKGATALTPLTPNEQYTHVSLWCLVAAPLIFSGDITRLDDFTLNLLTNDEVIDVDQDPLGKPGRRVAIDGDLEVWARDMEDGTKAVGLFNRGEDTTSVTAKWADLGLKGKRIVRDLWRQQDLGKYDGEFNATVPRHGVVLIRLRAK